MPDTWDLEWHEDELSTMISLDTLNRLCEALHLSAHELLGQSPPEYHIAPSGLRASVLEDCRRRAWTIEQFGDEVGWDVQGLIDDPYAYLLSLNLEGLQDISRHLGINPLAAIPLPIAD